MDYASLGVWGDALCTHVSTCESDYLTSLVGSYDLTTCDGVRGLAAHAIAELTNNRVPTTIDAVNLWQASQCLKKFRYGPQPPLQNEMFEGWIKRNHLAGLPLPSECLWILDEARKLLAPLGPAYEAVRDCSGRFGNGAVYEGYSLIGRWNEAPSFTYNVRDPDCIAGWCTGLCPHLTARCQCVPKDMFKLRSITVEPAEATFLQQLVRSRLLRAVQVLPRNSAIPSQLWGCGPEVQRARALRGSLLGNLSTIDLSDASDSVRWDVVQAIFPTNIVADLERSRSPYCEVAGTRYCTHMYAGMGNATTFVVESIYFWALCTVLSNWLRVFTPVSVFGDDIVLHTRVARHPLFQRYLACLGITLNMEKSGLSDGPGFREACGLAAYLGVELPLLRIKGYHVKNPEELVALCDLLTQALAPNSRYAPFVRGLGIELGTRLVQDLHLPVLPEQPDRAGVYLVDASETIARWSYRTRWDPKLQHPQVKCRVLRTKGKTFVTKDVTSWEALGILSGQLRTQFADSEVGYHSPLTRIEATDKRYLSTCLKSEWVTVSSSDASFVDLMSEK